MYARGVSGSAASTALGLGLTAAEVLRMPERAAFGRLEQLASESVGKFTARQRALPTLRAQVLAIGVYAGRLPVGSTARRQLEASYATERAHVDRLDGLFGTLARDISAMLGKMRELKVQLGLGAIPQLIAATVIAISVAVTSACIYFDTRARAVRDALKFAERQHYTPEQTRALFDAMGQAGANPNSGALGTLLSGLTNTALVVAGALILFPILWGSFKRRMRRA